MMKIMLGVLLILLGGTINIGEHIIEWTPNFIGSLLLLSAMNEFKIRDTITKQSLYVLTGLFFVNYILQIKTPSQMPFILGPILGSGTLLWGIYIAMKLVRNIENEKGIISKDKSLKISLGILLAAIIIVTSAGTALVSSSIIETKTAIFLALILGISGFVGMITRYVIIYLFYKKLKGIKLANNRVTS